MKIIENGLISVLSQFNPWWRELEIVDLPDWKRTSFNELLEWAKNPPASRATLLTGARGVGKTTLLMQIIDALLKDGVSPSNILYVNFDHPLIRIAGIELILQAWQQRQAITQGIEYLFLDEAQFISDCGTWIKYQVDFNKNRRIFFAQSSIPLVTKDQESGVGRWHTVKLGTLSFYEYLELKKIELPKLPEIKSLNDLFNWSSYEFHCVKEIALPYIAHFHQYLVRGGFPQTAQIKYIVQAQRLIREDIIDKILKRDMIESFSVRNVLALEQIFLYLCIDKGDGPFDMSALCESLDATRPTVQHFIEILEAIHLIYRLKPFGYGKDILRAKYKIYLTDPAISSSVFLKGEQGLDNDISLNISIESAICKHLIAHYRSSVCFNYNNREINLIIENENQIILFCMNPNFISSKNLSDLIEFCQKKSIKEAYIITKELNDFGFLENSGLTDIKFIKIPVSLLCYWLGKHSSNFIIDLF